MADHLHLHHLASAFGQVEHGSDGGYGDDGENDRRDQRPRHLDLGVPVDLFGFLASRAVAEEDHDKDQPTLDQYEDPDGDPEHHPEQVVDPAGKRALRVKRVEGSILDVDQAACRHQHGQTQHTARPPPPRS